MTENIALDGAGALPWEILAPYMSVVVLTCTAEVPETSFEIVRKQLLKEPITRGSKHTKVVVSDKISRSSSRRIDSVGTLEQAQIDQLFGCVRQIDSAPAWTGGRGPYVDRNYELNLAVRRGGMLAVKVGESTSSMFQKWLNRPPRPMVEKIAPRILSYTFLMGEAKGLWLHHAGSRSRNRADSKTTAGVDLRDTLDVFDDSAYALGAARCKLPEESNLVALQGTIGSTLQSSQLWLKQMDGLAMFLQAVSEVFDLIEAATQDDQVIVEAFPELAEEVLDLTQVFGAYEVSLIDADQLPPTLIEVDTARQDADLLQDAALNVVGNSNTAKFKLDVGTNRSESGTLAVMPESTGTGFMLKFGILGEPSNLAGMRPVLDALQGNDLLAVYYESGHTYSGGRISKPNVAIAPFPNWHFCDFDLFDIEREKPFNLRSSREIHERIGKDGDNSLLRGLFSISRTVG